MTEMDTKTRAEAYRRAKAYAVARIVESEARLELIEARCERTAQIILDRETDLRNLQGAREDAQAAISEATDDMIQFQAALDAMVTRGEIGPEDAS